MTQRTGVDALVMTAMKEEYDAAKAVLGESAWRDHGAGGPEPYATSVLHTPGGAPVTVALARPTHIGGRSIGAITTALTERLRPGCLAMCGVCAGNPRATAPGDVVVAAPAYEWDEGKHTDGVFRADPQQFPQDARWTRAVQEFDPAGLPSHGVATDAEAEVWYLERLHRGQDPRTHPARPRYFPPGTWQSRLARLESDGLITWREGDLVLTGTGRDRIRRVLYTDVDGPDRLPFAVFAGPMASGSAVMAERDVWDRLEVGQRRLLALEMEAATIATVAHERRVPHWLIAKGVMDHADHHKDDRFKGFAARASAEVLFALLGQLSAPSAGAPRPAPSAGAVPSVAKRAVVGRLTYDWQDLAEVVGVPSSETRRFRSGDEASELWAWLQERARLRELPGALDAIGRTDLADLLRPHL